MGILATVRYLAMAQVQRVVFAERNGINLVKRMLALAGEGKYGVEQPYLKKLSYRNWEGMRQTAWALTPLGYNVAASVLPEAPRSPAVEAGANFIEHGLLLNELYVQLLEAPLRKALSRARARAEGEQRPSRSFTRVKAGLYARAAHPEFRWLSHDEVRLPWQEYEMKTNKTRDRVIVPDATLEIPGEVIREERHAKPRKYAGRRYFLEAETGSHTIVAGDAKPGATTNKLDRYSTFVNGFAGNPIGGDTTTWYTKAYRDNFEPMVIFLVRTASREAAVNGAIRDWRQKNHYDVRAEAFTVERAADKVIWMLGEDFGRPARPPRTVTSAEYRLIHNHYFASRTVIHECRNDARGRNAAVPDYPKDDKAMLALVEKLGARR